MSTMTTPSRPVTGASGSTLASMVRDSALRRPGRPAVRHQGTQISYAELWADSSRWLDALQRSGVAPGDLVGVCLERTPMLIAALIGIHRAGAAYVPLDPGYPTERIEFILRDCGAALVLAQAGTADVLGGRDRVLAEELPSRAASDPAQTDGTPDDPAEGAGSPDDVAYVIYTSGSTGTPKGVLIEHRQVIELVRWGLDTYSEEELAGVLASTSVCFDLSVFEIFVTLAAGGTLVLADNALELPTLADRDHVRLINTVPSAMTVLTAHGALPASVRTVNLAGEPLTRALSDAVYANSHVHRLLNLYGPSEDTTYSTASTVPRDSAEEPSIGVPLPGTRAYLLDEEGSAVPDGAVGELYLAGAGVARGYLHRPDLTAERFLADPFVAGDRMYRTGDLCLLGPDGQLHYRGRTDHQVKIRGFRVELGEIEATLVQHPAVSSAVVVVQPDDRSGPALVAHVQGAYAEGLAAELTSLVRGRLPHYMVPSAVVVLERLPLTPNGKTDRAALSRVDLAAQAPLMAGEAAETDDERLVAGTWSTVLGLSTEVPVDCSFADLGGNSLQAASVLHRLAQRTGRRVPLTDFPVAATVRDLAATLSTTARQPAAELVSGDRGTGRTYPAAPAQTQLQLLEELAAGRSAVSVMPVRLTIDQELDLDVLHRALDLLPRRHEVLRTSLTAGPEGVVAAIAEPFEVPLVVVGSAAELEAQARLPLPLDSGHLLAAAVLPPAEGRTDLLLRVHHAACDGWSIRLLLRDLAEVYGALAAGREPTMVQSPSFPDCAQWLEEAREAERERLRAFWADRLVGADPSATLPPTAPHRALRTPGRPGDVLHHAVDPELLARVRAFAATQQVTTYAVLTAITAIRVHRESDATDICFHVPVSTRRHPAFEDVVGPFLETAVSRIDLAGDPSFAELTERVAQSARRDLDHSWARSEDMMAPLAITRDGSGHPIGQLLIAVQNYGSAHHVVDDLTWSYHSEPTNGGAKTDIGFFWELDAPGGPVLNIEYDTDLHSAEGIAGYRAQLLRLLDGALGAPDAPISHLAWAGPQDLAVVSEHNRSEPLVAASTTPESVAVTVARTPSATAVLCPRRGALSYAELDAAARGLATRLTALTGGPGSEPVAVACRRGADTIIAMLAAWHAGRPYLPLDTGHPVARLRAVLQDSGAVAIVADASAPSGLADLAPVLDADGPLAAPVGPPTEQLAAPVATDPAYLIYTSGSTGRPKGVRISHGALANFLQAMGEVVPLTAQDTITQVTTPSFDISGLEVWLPLVSGARVAVIEEHAARDGFALADAIAATGATVVQMTPSGWSLLLDADRADLRGVRALVGAESVPPQLAARLVEQCAETWNVYGPTEATIWSCAHRVRPEDTRGSTVPVGRPLGNTRAWVLDPAGHPTAVGSIGVIHLSGTSLADGYHQRDELTAAAFTTGEHLPGRPRLYRTGDLGRLRLDGLLECLGRLDHQVKVRGVRIELDEVDVALASAPGVRRASSRVLPQGPAAGQLVGYLVSDGPELSQQAVRDHVVTVLPAAMVPTLWQVLTELPLNTSGKVDRAALPEPALEPSPAGSEELTELEEFLADLWLSHLPVQRVPATTSFFDLGGHSLTATRVVASVREELGLPLTVASLFHAPTLRGFADAVEQALVEDEAATEGSR
ncbi:non-ribosomal peptide synthetase [Ornithinimicrobium murale]|uniref:non-ribosomal peptide synthetase n=1 Tax=Ornithinimicrobium murale TaxID=1050153 RepID=UPI0013B3675F|nr:non-ribosomal peptide synthetase [Ornithinimicrobium murale]